jgi:hypothetical protein
MSEQVRKVSCGPQPTVPVPFAQTPQEFPKNIKYRSLGSFISINCCSYGCETWSFSLEGEHKLNVFEYKVKYLNMYERK